MSVRNSLPKDNENLKWFKSIKKYIYIQMCPLNSKSQLNSLDERIEHWRKSAVIAAVCKQEHHFLLSSSNWQTYKTWITWSMTSFSLPGLLMTHTHICSHSPVHYKNTQHTVHCQVSYLMMSFQSEIVQFQWACALRVEPWVEPWMWSAVVARVTLLKHDWLIG